MKDIAKIEKMALEKFSRQAWREISAIALEASDEYYQKVKSLLEENITAAVFLKELSDLNAVYDNF